MSNIDLLTIEKHAIDSPDSTFGGLYSLIVHKSITFGVSVLIKCDFTRKNTAKSDKRIVKDLTTAL